MARSLALLMAENSQNSLSRLGIEAAEKHLSQGQKSADHRLGNLDHNQLVNRCL
jgi:hypothetical protein